MILQARVHIGGDLAARLRSPVAAILALSVAAAVAASCSSDSPKPANPAVSIGTKKPVPINAPTAKPGYPPTPSRWKIVFDDEFKAPVLDASRWATCYWFSATTCTNETTKELELYQPQNVRVGQGMLQLTARRQSATGTIGNGSQRHFDYTSGIVSGASPSATLFSFKYGFVDTRAKVPEGQGLWSAFWMLPVDRSSLPEVDIFEVFGQRPDVDNTTTHWRAAGTAQQLGHKTTVSYPDLSAGWHDFGLEWDPTSLVWYLDGKPIWKLTQHDTIPRTEMYLLADLAVGGSFGGPPAPQTTFPSTLLFDYVRVWQHR